MEGAVAVKAASSKTVDSTVAAFEKIYKTLILDDQIDLELENV